MREESDTVKHFTSEMIDIIARIWIRSAISIIDIRHKALHRESPLQDYQLPCSMLIYTYGGVTDVQLNQTFFRVERFGAFHGGKGSTLSVVPVDSRIDSFMVLYRADSPFLQKRELHRLLEQVNPFMQRYGYSPRNPVKFVELFRDMLEHWNRRQAMSHFYVKHTFLQLMYQVYIDLEREGTRFLQPDPVATTKHYLDAHYRQPILLQEIADMLAISSGQLTKLFKRREGKTLQHYLIQKRLEAAAVHLETHHATVQEIAAGCGFTDELNLIRMFKKHYRMTPSEYRKIKITNRRVQDIDNDYHYLYNEKGLDPLVKTQRDGELTMFRQGRSKERMLAAAISMMLLLSACTANTPVTNGGASVQPSAQVQQAQSEKPEGTDASAQIRTINTTLGDVEVPMDPQRVVVQYLMGDVIALGITPAGISDVYDGAAFAELVKDSVSLGWMPEWESESIMQLDPDLILVASEDDVKKYSKIAPTVFIPYGDMTQDERLAFMGEVLNRQEAAAEAIELYNTTLEQAKASLVQAGFDKYTVSVFEGGADATITAFGSKFGAGSVVYASLGLHAPDAVQSNILDKDSYNEAVSFEVLQQYTGDFIIRNTYEGMADLSKDAIWNSLEAVQNNRVIEMKFGLNYYSDIYSAIAQINYVTEALLRAGVH